jgi:hypothetical protein
MNLTKEQIHEIEEEYCNSDDCCKSTIRSMLELFGIKFSNDDKHTWKIKISVKKENEND